MTSINTTQVPCQLSLLQLNRLLLLHHNVNNVLSMHNRAIALARMHHGCKRIVLFVDCV
jgi:hypothetical protein